MTYSQEIGKFLAEAVLDLLETDKNEDKYGDKDMEKQWGNGNPKVVMPRVEKVASRHGYEKVKSVKHPSHPMDDIVTHHYKHPKTGRKFNVTSNSAHADMTWYTYNHGKHSHGQTGDISSHVDNHLKGKK